MNEFVYNPIKIRHIDINTHKWLHSYIFVGTVPGLIEKELNKIENNQDPNDKILKKFYGEQWRRKLGIQDIKGGSAQSINKLSEAPDDIRSLASIYLDDSITGGLDTASDLAEHLPDDIQQLTNLYTESTDIYGGDDDLSDLLGIDLNLDFLNLSENQEKPTKHIKKDSGITFIKYLAYPVDSILHFKMKIAEYIGIPIYRQHLWYKTHDRTIPLYYSILLNDHVESIDIEHINTQTQLEGIPINLEYYNQKDNLKIIARDPFELLGNIYTKHGTTEYFITDLADQFDTQVIYSKFKNDRYQLELLYYGFVLVYYPMITFGVFMDYLKNEAILKEVYPELFNYNDLELQARITDQAYSTKPITNLETAIIETTLTMNTKYMSIDMLLSLRNLFDALELNALLSFVKAYVLYEGKPLTLLKSFMNEPEPSDIIPINSILIKIRTNLDTNENMKLIIFKNGNYQIKTNWRPETHMTFNKIIGVVIKHVNPVIELINTKLSDQVKYYNINIQPITKSNITFTETTISFKYDLDMTEARLGILKQILNDYVRAGIIIQKEATIPGYEYYFSKGMYNHDPMRIDKQITLDNYYGFLSDSATYQKWDALFVKSRLLQIITTASQITFIIYGIKDNIEMDSFHLYLNELLTRHLNQIKSIKSYKDDILALKSQKTLKNLKNQDPLLYDFKKIYNSKIVYSKICQKPYQPLMLSESEYKSLSGSKKANATKYWNFTRQEPVWYSCPNHKYPYIKFIIKQHPRDFCIPCCKKIEMSDRVNPKKQQIHNQCLSQHCYTGEKINVTKGSHYIASYGKNIEPGRISRLPENTLEPLFFDMHTIDQECSTSDGYYLFGVPQYLPEGTPGGYINCLASALSLTLEELFIDTIHRIKENPDQIRIFSNLTAEELIFTIHEAKTDLNDTFRHIAYYYYGVNTILFEDTQKEMIDLILPSGLKSADALFVETHKNLVILKFNQQYYPIYLFNTEIFKRTGIIDVKLFLNESGLISIIRSVVQKTLQNNIVQVKDALDLDILLKSPFQIKKYYVNKSNRCYGVVIEHHKLQTFLPCAESYYNSTTNAVTEAYQGEYDIEWSEFEKIIKVYNVWVKRISGDVLLMPLIEPEKWIRVEKSIIGFESKNLMYYFKPISKAPNKLPIQILLYHPYDINKHIQISSDKPINISKELYHNYIYQLTLLQFIKYFNKQRNTTLRKKILQIIDRITTKDLSGVKEIMALVPLEDTNKIKILIMSYVSSGDKSALKSDFEMTPFDFDKIELEKLKKLSKPDIKNEITRIAKQIIEINDTIKIADFPNVLSACGDTHDYCNKGKLIMTKAIFTNIMDVLANDIANESKNKWLFNQVYVAKYVNYFKFIHRPGETIRVS